MGNACGRIVEKDGIGPSLLHPNAEVGLLAANRLCPDSTDAVLESADLHKRRAAERHVGADEVADRAQTLRQTLITAAYDPIEFSGLV